MNFEEVMAELKSYADERTRNTHLRHGAREPLFGVKVSDLKKILKKTKKDHQLSLSLYESGNSDAMYLAGLMADEKKITKEQLNNWVRMANWYYISEYTVPGVAAESPFGFELGLEWIRSEKETIAAAGWSTLSNYASLYNSLDLEIFSALLDEVVSHIHQSQNRVKYAMNGFVIAVGCFVPELTEKSKNCAKAIGSVDVYMGETACKTPLALEYIEKVEKMNRIGKKRKMARC